MQEASPIADGCAAKKQTAVPSNETGIFSDNVKWIWDNGDRGKYNYYLRAKKPFFFSTECDKKATLLITAEAYYQVWINGRTVGHGPSKSAEGARAVDCYEVGEFLNEGQNLLEVLVLSVGVGTMNYCLGPAGVIFELRTDKQLAVSDSQTLVCAERARARPAVRRWVMPCVEIVEADCQPQKWEPAREVESNATLYRRRVPLPTREAVLPIEKVFEDTVKLANFSVSFPLKRALIDADAYLYHETFNTPATVKLELISDREQDLYFSPTLGAVDWYFEGKHVFEGSGWEIRDPYEPNPCIHLKAGSNLLTGKHRSNHFNDISLAGFSEFPIKVSTLHVERGDGKTTDLEPWLNANPYDLAVSAQADAQGDVVRQVWDLGAVYNGWIAFEAEGDSNTVLLLAFFEAMDKPSRRIQWPSGSNNALSYRLHKGVNRFESFLPYGVRYIAVYKIGANADIRNLRLLKATCSDKSAAYFKSEDPLLNAIYESCIQTIESGTDDTYIDCPTFEQVNWNFDNRLASWGALWMGDNRAITRNSILLFAEDPHRIGLVNSQMPSWWLKMPIPNYAFHWILWCWDYYWHTGDLCFLRKLFPFIKQGIDEALARINPQGLFAYKGVWHFLEWGHNRDDDHAVNAAEQAGLHMALEKTALMAKTLNEPSQIYIDAADQLKAAVNRLLWRPERNAYADSLHEDGTLSSVSSQVSNAWIAISSIADETWAKNLAAQLAQGVCPLLAYGSPLGLFYIMELWDKYQMPDAIFAQIRQRWGDMVNEGDRTTWEHFKEFGHGNWPTRSRCHAFSAYILKYYIKYLLGIEISAPGVCTVNAKNEAASINAGVCQGNIRNTGSITKIHRS